MPRQRVSSNQCTHVYPVFTTHLTILCNTYTYIMLARRLPVPLICSCHHGEDATGNRYRFVSVRSRTNGCHINIYIHTHCYNNNIIHYRVYMGRYPRCVFITARKKNTDLNETLISGPTTPSPPLTSYDRHSTRLYYRREAVKK